jgi:hypothetical protein
MNSDNATPETTASSSGPDGGARTATPLGVVFDDDSAALVAGYSSSPATPSGLTATIGVRDTGQRNTERHPRNAEERI